MRLKMNSSFTNKLCAFMLGMMMITTVAAFRSPDSYSCANDDDCNTPFTSCSGAGYCAHKNVFPIEWQEMIGALIIFFAISLGNAVGIGGGSIIVTVGASLFYFTAKQSVAIANATIFFACVTGYIQNFNAKHPLKNATLVDYGIVQAQMPLIGLGSFVGAQVNEVLPEVIIFILLFITLCYATYTSFALAIETSQKEERVDVERKEISVKRRVKAIIRKQDRMEEVTGEIPDVTTPMVEGEAPNHVNDSFVSVQSNTEEIVNGEVVRPEVTYEDKDISDIDLVHLIGARRAIYAEEEINPVLEGIFYGEQNHFTIDKAILVLVPFGSIAVISLFRGSSEFKSVIGVTRCNFMDFFLFFLECLILLFFSVINIVLLKKDHQIRRAFGYKFVRGDIQWNDEAVTAFALLAFVGGFVGSMVGLSTEVLFTPFYIKFGAPPGVAGVTSQFLGIFATLGAIIVFAFNGYLHFPMGVWLGGVGAVATAIGSSTVGKFIGSTGKASVPVLIIASLILASLIAEGATGIVRTIRNHNDGHDIWELGNYCD